jgi:hypothetical protein
MNLENTAQILKIGYNGAVVKLPDRKFPGMIIQGDSLSNLINELILIRDDIAGNKCTDDTLIGIDEIVQQLKGRIQFYEETLKYLGIDLPYNKTWSK